MQYTTPKPVNRTDVKADFVKYEQKYRDQSKTLSQFFDKQVVNLWDVSLMSPAELMVLKENKAKKSAWSALVILELKN